MLRALDLKLLRDLWHLRGQVLAIAAVIMGEVATLVMSLSTYDSLVDTHDRFYGEYRFADVFANLKRAPESLAERLLPGRRGAARDPGDGALRRLGAHGRATPGASAGRWAMR